MVSSGVARRLLLILVFAIAFLSIVFLNSYREAPGSRQAAPMAPQGKATAGDQSGALLTGHAIAPRLGNETAKAELGRAAWKVLHTTFARFPEKPTGDEKEALRSYVHLFQRLYPCGECAEHFGKVLAKYPPQVSSRSAAAMWGCFVHNVVNKRLNKAQFDCEQIGDAYDCGCGEEDPGT